MNNTEQWNKIFEAEINARQNTNRETEINQQKNNVKISSIILLVLSAFLFDLAILCIIIIFTAQASLASKITICIFAVLMAVFFTFSLAHFIKIKKKNK